MATKAMPSSCLLAIIAVSYFNSSDLDRLISSLQSQEIEDWILLIADNSSDELENHKIISLESRDDRIRTVRSSTNLGYMPAAIGASAMLPKSDWTLICNSDVELGDARVFSKILGTEKEGLAVLAPGITDQHSGADLNPFLERPPSGLWLYLRLAGTSNRLLFYLMKKIHSFRLRLKRRAPKTTTQSPRKIYAPHGSFFIMPSGFARELMGSEFQMLYGEEFTMARKAHNAGLRILYQPEIRVIHHSHASTGSLKGSQARKFQLEALKTHIAK
jgi:GT2 family glycosyltransferase